MKFSFSRLSSLQTAAFPWLALFALWALWMLEPFFFIGMTTADQIGFSLTPIAEIPAEAWRQAEQQGRVYFIFTKLIDLAMAARPETLVVQGANILFYASSVLWLAITVFRDPLPRWLLIGFFLCFGWNAYHHMPPAAYPLVNHVAFPLWAALAAIARQYTSRAPSWTVVAGFFVLCFAAFFQYEPVTLMSAVIIVWVLANNGLDPTAKRRLGSAALGAALAYAALYLAWAKRHPAQYDGLRPGSFAWNEIAEVIYAYTFGALPLLDRAIHFVYLRWGDASTGRLSLYHFLNANLSLSGLEFAIFVAGMTAFAVLALKIAQRSSSEVQLSSIPQDNLFARHRMNALAAIAAFSLCLAVAPNLLLGFSAKYQSWVNRWHETYLTSQLALYGWCVLAAALSAALLNALRGLTRVVTVIALVALASAIALPVRELNEQFALRQRSLLARWEALDALANLGDDMPAGRIVAPQFYFDAFTHLRDWGDYWQRYAAARYQKDLLFLPSFPVGPTDDDLEIALVQFSLGDDGRLQCLTVQTKEATTLVAKPESRPAGLLSHSGEDLIALDWKHGVRRIGSYHVLSLDHSSFPSFVGLDKRLEPFRTLPRLHGIPASAQPPDS